MKQSNYFYTGPIWRALRQQALQRDRWHCVICGRSVTRKGMARVDHIKTRKERPDLALELSNLRTLCASCDNQAHREKGSGAPQREERFVPRGCGADGWPLARRGA